MLVGGKNGYEIEVYAIREPDIGIGAAKPILSPLFLQRRQVTFIFPQGSGFEHPPHDLAATSFRQYIDEPSWPL